MATMRIELLGLGLLLGTLTACGGSSSAAGEDQQAADGETSGGGSSNSRNDESDDDSASDDDSSGGNQQAGSSDGVGGTGAASSGTSTTAGGSPNTGGSSAMPGASQGAGTPGDIPISDDTSDFGDDEAFGDDGASDDASNDFESEPSDESAGAPADPVANTNVSLGGSQDFGFFRQQLASGQVPQPGSFDAAGFFAEHHTRLPTPNCGEQVCLQAMVGVMGNLLNGQNCTMLQLGLNSPIAADPSARPPLSLAVVVDTSGSMNNDNQIQFVRDGLEMLIDGLRDGDRFALITYDTNVDTLFEMADVDMNRSAIRDLVRNLEANGSTNLYDGLEEGYREVFSNYDSGRQNRVILLSDGNPTVGVTDPDQILTMSEGYNSDGVGLTTIGLGTSFNFDLMRDLALKADGNFYFLESAGAVSEVFDEELSFFTVPIAFDLKLDVRAGEDYEFGRAVGSPLWENNDGGGSLEVPSVFIAHRESDEDVTEDGGRRGGGSALLLELMPRLRVDAMEEGQESADIAVIDVEFREPGSDEIVSDTVVVNYPHAPWETPSSGFFENANSDSDDVTVVTKSFVMLNVFVGIEQAVAAYHENFMDPTQSVAELTALLAALEDYNEEVEDVDIDYDIELVEELIVVMLQNDVPEPDPEFVEIPEDPWPAD